jgi:hypothetical protein
VPRPSDESCTLPGNVTMKDRAIACKMAIIL